MHDISLGIYEKALPDTQIWQEKFAAAAECGFDFVELSIDSSPERISRLDWSNSNCLEVRNAAKLQGVRIHALILSAHRSIPLGSQNPSVRKRAREILVKAVQLASELEVPVVQIAGYFVFDEPHAENSENWFLEGLERGVRVAEEFGVVLGLENMDGQDIISIESAVHVCKKVNSEHLMVFPDVGNLAANGLDVCKELKLGRDWFVGMHLKDTKLGEFRRVPFGEGIVPFEDLFRTLIEIGYEGSYTLEMWNDQIQNPIEISTKAHHWMLDVMEHAKLM